MKPVTMLLSCLCAAALAGEEPLAPGSPEPAANTWVQVKPKYVPPPSGGQIFPMGWNQMVYDPAGKRLLMMDRWYDEVRRDTIYANAVVAYDVPTNTAACLKLNNWTREAAGGGYRTVAMPGNAQDPTPVDRHPYGCLAFVPEQNALYLSGGANQGAPGNHPKDTWKFDLATAKWSQVKSDKDPPNGLDDSMAYDPANKVIVRSCHGVSTWLLDVQTGQWRDAGAKDNPRTGLGAAMTYDSKRGRMLLYGGPGPNAKNWADPGSKLWSYAVKDNAWKPLADGPVPARAPGLAYDSRHDLVMMRAEPGAGQSAATCLYFPEQDRWQKLDAPAGAAQPPVTYHTLAYDPAHDVFVQGGGTWDKPQWWLFRLAPEKLPAAAGK
jgi:hypothetical protein